MKRIEQPDSKPVKVRYPNGLEDVGIAVSDDVVEIGAIGLYMELNDLIQIDGVPRQVTGIEQSLNRQGRPAGEGVEHTCRLRHRNVPS